MMDGMEGVDGGCGWSRFEGGGGVSRAAGPGMQMALGQGSVRTQPIALCQFRLNARLPGNHGSTFGVSRSIDHASQAVHGRSPAVRLRVLRMRDAPHGWHLG